MQWEAFAVAAGWGVTVLICVTAAEPMAKARKRDHEAWLLLAALVGPLALLGLKWLGPATPLSLEQARKKDRAAITVSVFVAIVLAAVVMVPLFKACFRL